MYLSRLTFHTLPGKTGKAEQALQTLVAMVGHVGGIRPRVLRNHFASLGAPDVVFEQEAQDLETLERQIQHVTENSAFQQWTGHMSGVLAESPNVKCTASWSEAAPPVGCDAGASARSRSRPFTPKRILISWPSHATPQASEGLARHRLVEVPVSARAPPIGKASAP